MSGQSRRLHGRYTMVSLPGLIAGDISWALKLADAQPDLEWIAALPGRKILSRGNHDYWWESSGRVRRQLPPSIAVVQGDAIDLGEAVVCGTRGWITPDTTFSRAIIQTGTGAKSRSSISRVQPKSVTMGSATDCTLANARLMPRMPGRSAAP